MCGFRSITSLPHSIFCIRQRNCFPSWWELAYGRKTINVSFVEFKGQDTFFVLEWLRQKGLENLCEIFEIFHVLYDECDN